MLRAKNGSSMIAVFEIALPSEASVVFTSCAAASTVTVSFVAPTLSKVTSRVAG